MSADLRELRSPSPAENRIEALLTLYQQRPLMTSLLSRIADCIPEGVWLDRVSARRLDAAGDQNQPDDPGDVPMTARLVLEGRGAHVQGIGELVMRLEQEGILHELQQVHLREVADPESDRRWFGFSIEASPALPSQLQLIAEAEAGEPVGHDSLGEAAR